MSNTKSSKSGAIKGTTTNTVDFDLNGLELPKIEDVISTAVPGGGKANHIPYLYKGDPMFKVSTIPLYVSGAYRNETEGKVSVEFTVCTHMNWKSYNTIKDLIKAKKTKDIPKSKLEEVSREDNHEQFWKDYRKRIIKLITDSKDENAKAIRTKIVKPKIETYDNDIKEIVYPATHRDGHPQAGEEDPERPPRFRIKCWTSDPDKKEEKKLAAAGKSKDPSAKKKLPTEEEAKEHLKANGGVDFGKLDLLTQIEHMNGEPCPLSDLMERPFVAIFHVLPGTLFMAAKNSGIQIKATKVIVYKLLEKKGGKKGITEEDRDDARRQFANIKIEVDDEEEKSGAENGDAGSESEGENNKPAAAGSKKNKKDKTEKKSSDDNSEKKDDEEEGSDKKEKKSGKDKKSKKDKEEASDQEEEEEKEDKKKKKGGKTNAKKILGE